MRRSSAEAPKIAAAPKRAAWIDLQGAHDDVPERVPG